MNNYRMSFVKKFDHYFGHKEVSNIIYLHDEADDERLDHVLFLEEANGDVVGLYIRGMNPLISGHRIDDLDDFNLYASYEEGLIERKEKFEIRVQLVFLFFATDYNELLGFYLANDSASRSLLVLFLQDKMVIEKNCSEYEAGECLKESMRPQVI